MRWSVRACSLTKSLVALTRDQFGRTRKESMHKAGMTASDLHFYELLEPDDPQYISCTPRTYLLFLQQDRHGDSVQKR